MNKFSKLLSFGLIVLTSLTFSASSQASLITYIYKGFGASGDIGGNAFSNVNFTITAIADTDNIGPWCCSAGQNTHLSTTIEIDGFASTSILTASHSWYGASVVGLGLDGSSNWMTFSDAALSGYDLSSDIGPVVAGVDDIIQFVNVATGLGELNFGAQQIRGSFQAITGQVSEPGMFGLIALSFVMLFRMKRKSA